MDFQGCQIFIACPNKELRQSTVESLRELEFEAYGIDDPVSLDVSEQRDSIFFLEMKNEERRDWLKMAEAFIKGGSACSLIVLGENDIPEGFQGAVGGTRKKI